MTPGRNDDAAVALLGGRGVSTGTERGARSERTAEGGGVARRVGAGASITASSGETIASSGSAASLRASVGAGLCTGRTALATNLDVPREPGDGNPGASIRALLIALNPCSACPRAGTLPRDEPGKNAVSCTSPRARSRREDHPLSAARFSPVREELRRVLHELRGRALSPGRGAAAVALGLFIGSIPIFGLHAPLVLVFCLWFRLDAVIAYLFANISNPLFAPFLITAEVQIGCYLRTGALLAFDRETIRSLAFSRFARDLFLGAPIFAAAVAIVGGALTFAILSIRRHFSPNPPPPKPYRLPESAPPWFHAAERVAGRYAPALDGGNALDRSRFHYVRTKLLGDPIARLIADVAGEAPGSLGEIADIGTGRGQLPILLLELGRATKAWGTDWDATKIAMATAASGAIADDRPALDARFEQGDARAVDVPRADTVLLIDLLHYFTIEEQDAILRRAASAVRPGGRLLVREADTERGWRSRATLLEERIFTALRFNRGERVRFRPAREIAAILGEAGLACEIRPAWGKTPFSNVLILGTRAEPTDTAP